VWASRSTTTGALQLGGSSSSGQIDFNVTDSGVFGFSAGITINNSGSLFVTGNMLVSNGVFPGAGSFPGIYAGSGNPNASVTARNGSLFMRYDGGANAHLYINTTGASSSGTTWTAVTD
jgi:hypothetical protein